MSAIDLVGGDWEQLRSQLSQVKEPIETSATLPPMCYSSDAFFAHELRSVFHKSWIGIGRSDRWQAPGDYAAMEIAGVPIAVLRDEHGVLRAYANSCRHRGARLLSGEGNCRTIRCPFHRWTYALDGRLVLAPRMDKTEGFQLGNYGLIPLRLDSRDGFVFVCLDDTAVILSDWLGDFSDVHAFWSLDDMVSTRRREFEVGCNWKGFMEVFNEYYHLPYVHPHSISGIYDVPDRPDPVRGQYASQFGATQGTGGLLEKDQEQSLPSMKGLTGRNRQGTRYTWVFPNLTFAASSEAVWVYETYPVNPGRTRVVMTICFPKETTNHPEFEERAYHYYARFDAAIEEDIPALENQQAGLSSPFARQGRFSYLEPSVANFACWYAKRVLDS